MNTAFILSAINAIHDTIIQHEPELESLDRAIGDGDHYINMKRGASAIVEIRSELTALSPDDALNKIGLKLLSTIGGASGPLLASFFMGMAKEIKAQREIKDQEQISLLAYAKAFSVGVDAIRQRGKAGLGEKTMLDVLIPVAVQFQALASQSDSAKAISAALIVTAEQGMLATKDLIATKGRAAGLGERAIGHIDPGAKSCQLMIQAVCNLIK